MDDVVIGDTVVVRAGEVVPVDGVVESPEAVVDESSLTGEPLPAVRERGEHVRSGTTNAGEMFELRAIRPAAESAYAAVVRLVRDAETQKAPFVRLADRYAIFFLPLTAVIAGVAWAVSGDPVRALAVFVVATPCPLILAAPIALVCGISRAARAGVIVKGGGVIEQLGEARTVLLDKTGTLTLGTPGDRGACWRPTASAPDELAAARGLARPGLGAPARGGARPRGRAPGAPAVLPRGGDGGARPRDRGPGRGPARRGRKRDLAAGAEARAGRAALGRRARTRAARWSPSPSTGARPGRS